MPVARGPHINARSAVIVGVAGVVIALLMGGAIIWLAGSGNNVRIQIGDTDFDAGSAFKQSDEIAANGPLLFSDVGGGRRDIILNHLGDDPKSGWYSFEARPADQPRDCFFSWDATAAMFVLTTTKDSIRCSDVAVDATGDGVSQFPVIVDDNGSVRVDINLLSQKQQETP